MIFIVFIRLFKSESALLVRVLAVLLPVLLLAVLLLTVLLLVRLLSVLLLAVLLLSVLLLIRLLSILLLPVLLLAVTILLLMCHVVLRLQDLLKSHEQFWLAGHSIAVLVNDPHCGIGLLLVDAIGAASHGEDVVEEEVKLIGVKGA